MKGPGLVGSLLFGTAALVLVAGWVLNRSGESAHDSTDPVPDVPAASTQPTDVVTKPKPDGAALYAQHCATCHMMDGYGVPNFQPGIVDGPVVAAGRDKVEAVIRAGSAALQDRPNPMGWEMPPLGGLGDAEINALTDYVMATFGPNASSG